MGVDFRTARDIDKKVEKILKDMGIKEPPLNVKDVLDHLKIYKNYYDLDDPSLIKEFKHKIQIGGKKAKDLLGKINLRGLCFLEENRILLDTNTPQTKEKWVTAHEIIHQITPTHYQILGDTAETLDPDYHEMIEAEANYGASTLIFMKDHFIKEALDYSPSIQSIEMLKKRYQNSITSTFRRYIENYKVKPIAGVVSTPVWQEPYKTSVERCRYYIKSPEYASKFSNISLEELMSIIDDEMPQRIGGPLGKINKSLLDIYGNLHEFGFESFFNRYDILTLIVKDKEVVKYY